MKINILDAKNRLSELIRSVQAGEEVIIAKRGQPVVRLVLVDPSEAEHTERPNANVSLPKWLDANPLPAHLRRSQAAIDTGIQRERDAWE